MPEERPCVLLADDHDLVAAGVRGLLEARYDVTAVVGDGRALLEAAHASPPDVIVTDLSMPGIDGIEATRRLHHIVPGVPVVILTMHDDVEHVRAAFEAGAAGFLVKSSAPLELFTAIDTVLAGRRYVTSTLAGEMMDSLLTRQPTMPESPLTDREAEIAGLVAEGLDNSEIAGRLCVAEVTVRTHILNIVRKLGFKNRVELARYALGQGLASLEEPMPAG